jgi:hypothetical protein
MLKTAGSILALLLLATPAWAIDFTVSGAVLTVTYTEPATNTDGSPLTDLARTNVYTEIQLAGQTPQKGPNVAASALTGGGAISTTVTVPIGAALAIKEANVKVWATATDTTGNESAPSAVVIKRVDQLAPSAPN